MQLTLQDVVRVLGVSERTVYRWIQQRSIPAFKVKGQYRFQRGELLEWATARKLAVGDEIFREPENAAVPLPTLAESLLAGGIFYRVGGGDRDQVLGELVEMARLPAEVDSKRFLRGLIAREELASTGVGDGVAIPHLRSPIVANLPPPMTVLGLLEKPVEFGALDGVPVHAVFLIVSPSLRAHLHLLSRLGYKLRDARFRRVLREQGSREQILAEARRIDERRLCSPAPGRAGLGSPAPGRSGLSSPALGRSGLAPGRQGRKHGR